MNLGYGWKDFEKMRFSRRKRTIVNKTGNINPFTADPVKALHFAILV